MPRITITGVGVDVDGSYDLDLEDSFTGNELHLIKKHSGVRAGEIGEAMEAGDYDLIVCLSKITMDRLGKDVPMDRLMGAKVGALTFGPTDAEKAEQEELEQLPPVSAPSGANENESSKSSSGPASANGSEQTPENDPLVIGGRVLPTGSESSPPKLGT